MILWITPTQKVFVQTQIQTDTYSGSEENLGGGFLSLESVPSDGINNFKDVKNGHLSSSEGSVSNLRVRCVK